MNWDRIAGNWKQAKGTVKAQWGKLTDNDLDTIAGKRDQLVGKIQNSYGIGKDEAEKQLGEWEARQRDPHENIDAGTRHLSALLMRFRYDVRLAVAAYNAGEKPVLLYRGVPPYPETREYVAQVLYHYNGTSERRIGAEIRRVERADGTVLYTNIPSLNGR